MEAEPAEFITGYHTNGRKGSRIRLAGATKGIKPPNDQTPPDMDRRSESLQGAQNMGLPRQVRGNPLGCGCQIATLCSIGKVDKEGYLEADYMCDSGWHNFMLFKLKQNANRSENSLKVNSAGEVIEETGQGVGEPE